MLWLVLLGLGVSCLIFAKIVADAYLYSEEGRMLNEQKLDAVKETLVDFITKHYLSRVPIDKESINILIDEYNNTVVRMQEKF